jgi:oxygen-dependent protoporphyrinogen oxidase
VALRVIQALGLGPMLTWANKETRGRRFVRAEHGGREDSLWPLEELPTALAPALSFAWRHGLPLALLRDVFRLFADVPVEGPAAAAAEAEKADVDAAPGTAAAAGDSVHAFFARHLNPGFAARFVSALTHGIFSGDSRQLLVRYAFPPLWRLRQAYGSIVAGGLLDARLKLTAAYADPEARETVPAAGVLDVLLGPAAPGLDALVARARAERVASLDGGLSGLITALADAGRHEGADLRLGARVDDMRPLVTDPASGGQAGRRARIAIRICAAKAPEAGASSSADADGTVVPTAAASIDTTTLIADAVISTLPPDALACLLARSTAVSDGSDVSRAEEVSAAVAHHARQAHRRAQAAVAALSRVRTLSIAVVTLVFRDTEFAALTAPRTAPGFGFLSPASAERGLLLGVVYDSCVFPDLAGPRHVVLTAMLGGADAACQEQVEALSERELLQETRHAMQRHLGVAAEPDLARLTRWTRAIPQFDATYARARAVLDSYVAEDAPWLFVAGKAFGSGVGVNDCISSALHAAGDCLHAFGIVDDAAVL